MNVRLTLQMSSQLELWSEELQHVELSADIAKAEQHLQVHTDSVTHMQNCTCDVLQRGHDILQVNSSLIGRIVYVHL